MPVPTVKHFYNSDADGGSLGFAAITGTTPATANTLFTLTRDRRLVMITNATDKIVLIARLRVGATVPVFVCACTAGAFISLDLLTNRNGYTAGDIMLAYAPVSLVSGTVYGSAL